MTMEEYLDVSHEGVLAGVPEGARCYVSIDIDALDMPLVPGCVSAEPEGMSYRNSATRWRRSRSTRTWWGSIWSR